MHIKPAMEALRSDPAAQRRASRAVGQADDKWRCDPSSIALERELARFSSGDMLQDLPQLSQLMRSHAAARELVTAWAKPFLKTLAEEPLAQIPFQHSYSGGFAMMQLAAAGNAALSLVCYEQRREERPPEAVHFADCEQHEIVLAGSGSAYRHRICAERRKGATIETELVRLQPGSTLTVESRGTARSIFDVRGHLLMLQLHRQPQDPGPTCDYALSDGTLLHQASGTKRDSQCEMAMAVLGAMGRTDAVPTMLALSESGTSQLRWEALRHALALETTSGFQRLEEVASDTSDPLSAHAAQVRQQLHATYPQLVEQEKRICPA